MTRDARLLVEILLRHSEHRIRLAWPGPGWWQTTRQLS
jgi:hypothetical protein